MAEVCGTSPRDARSSGAHLAAPVKELLVRPLEPLVFGGEFGGGERHLLRGGLGLLLRPLGLVRAVHARSGPRSLFAELHLDLRGE